MLQQQNHLFFTPRRHVAGMCSWDTCSNNKVPCTNKLSLNYVNSTWICGCNMSLQQFVPVSWSLVCEISLKKVKCQGAQKPRAQEPEQDSFSKVIKNSFRFHVLKKLTKKKAKNFFLLWSLSVLIGMVNNSLYTVINLITLYCPAGLVMERICSLNY